jgi:hypothetical protein
MRLTTGEVAASGFSPVALNSKLSAHRSHHDFSSQPTAKRTPPKDSLLKHASVW